MSASTFTTGLHTQLQQFQYGTAFRLADDLDRLEAVQQAGAAEAAVFYAARILEALTRAAVSRLGMQPARHAIDNLQILERYNLLPVTTAYWAHALRRLGNEVRHLRRRLRPDEPGVALAFLEFWVSWFFCSFALRPNRPSTARADGKPLRWSGQNDLRDLLSRLEVARGDAAALRSAMLPGGKLTPLALRSPAIVAVGAEMLLDCGDNPGAGTLLAAGVPHFRDDDRLQQLQGLHASRTDNLDEARRLLEDLRKREREEQNEETAGILAGICKRLWLKDRQKKRGELERSHEIYLEGWIDSGQGNAYLGVNAAATALWLGRKAESANLARQVRRVLTEREAAVGGVAHGAVGGSFWDEVTLAEAVLILGQVEEANRLYAAAFAAHPGLDGAIASARRQAHLTLEHLGGDAAARAPVLAEE